jgi:hypothetical protein
MPEYKANQPPRSYFALTRLILLLRGGDAARGEENSWEASAVGWIIFALTYLIFVQWLRPGIGWSIVLLFGTWVFWLIVVCINSLAVILLRMTGFFRHLSNARAQNILVSAEVTLLAFLLVKTRGLPALFGWVWLALTAGNLAAAIVLRAGRRSYSQ